MMKNLLFVSLWGWIFLSSCVSARSGYQKAGERMVDGKELPGIVDSLAGVNRFNLQFDMAQHHFSGMLLVKRMGEQRFRTVFTTHFGLKVFDFEFVRDSLVVHYCLEPIHKRKMIRLFQNDFSFLFDWPGRRDCTAKVYKNKAEDVGNIEIYRFNRNLFYLKNLDKGRVEKITSGRGWCKITWIFENFRTIYPNQIIIRHAFWPIQLKLERL